MGQRLEASACLRICLLPCSPASAAEDHAGGSGGGVRLESTAANRRRT